MSEAETAKGSLWIKRQVDEAQAVSAFAPLICWTARFMTNEAREGDVWHSMRKM
jgi:hypothetical protein